MASLCSLSQQTVLQNQINIDNNEFVTISLLPEVQVQSEVNATVEFFKSSASTGIISFLNYLRITTQANYLISALNTNAAMIIEQFGNEYYFYGFSPIYAPYNSYSAETDIVSGCGNANPTPAAILRQYPPEFIYFTITYWYLPDPGTPMVKGFFGGCTPLESLLPSTLDCLYDIICLQLLIDYFPSLNQVCMTLFYHF